MSRRPERAPLDHYLDCICRRLWFASARERRETREELRQHLEALAAHAARTAEPVEAMEDAMEKFGDPKQIAQDLSRQHLRRRRWLSALIKTVKVWALAVLVLCLGLTGYWYFGLSRPMEQEPALAPVPSAAATLVAIQAAHDGYARQIRSVRFQSEQAVLTHYQGHEEKSVPHTFQVASKGGKYYSRDVQEMRYGTEPDDVDHSENVRVFDGKTMRDLLTEWGGPAGSPRAKETYRVTAYLSGPRYKPYDPDEVLQYGYKVHDAWIGDVFRHGHPVVEGTVMHPQFGPLTVVRCRDKAPWGSAETVRLWLAPKLGWLAVKTETQETSLRPNLPTLQINEISTVTKVGSLWAATDGNLRVDYAALGHRQRLIDRPRHFTGIAFNDVSDSLFSVRYPVGTNLWTMDTNLWGGRAGSMKVSILGPSGQWEAQPLLNSPGIASLWPFALAGIVVLGGVGFAVLRMRQRGVRLTA